MAALAFTTEGPSQSGTPALSRDDGGGGGGGGGSVNGHAGRGNCGRE